MFNDNMSACEHPMQYLQEDITEIQKCSEI